MDLDHLFWLETVIVASEFYTFVCFSCVVVSGLPDVFVPPVPRVRSDIERRPHVHQVVEVESIYNNESATH